MMRTLKALFARFGRSKDAERRQAAREAERDLADARRDALVEAQNREITRG